MVGGEGAVGGWWNELKLKGEGGREGRKKDKGGGGGETAFYCHERLQMKRQAQQQWVNPK